jgi:hypothetical protein
MSHTLTLIALLSGTPNCTLLPDLDKRGRYKMPTQNQVDKRANCSTIIVPNRPDLTLTKNKQGCFEGDDTMARFKLCKVNNVWYFLDQSENPNNKTLLTTPIDK